MLNHADVTFQDNKFLVSGDLNFGNVMSVYAKSVNYLNQCPEFVFDFSGLNSSNSAGLALVMEWIKFAKRCGKPIKFEHLSKDLKSIAHAAGIDVLIDG